MTKVWIPDDFEVVSLMIHCLCRQTVWDSDGFVVKSVGFVSFLLYQLNKKLRNKLPKTFEQRDMKQLYIPKWLPSPQIRWLA